MSFGLQGVDDALGVEDALGVAEGIDAGVVTSRGRPMYDATATTQKTATIQMKEA